MGGAHLLPARQGARRAHALVDRRRRRRLARRAARAGRAGGDPRRLRPRGLPVLPHERRRASLAVGLGRWDWVGAVVLTTGCLVFFSATAGNFSRAGRSRPATTGSGCSTTGSGPPAPSRSASACCRSSPRLAGARPAEGRAEDAGAARVHCAARCGRGRLRPLHRRQGVVPLDRLRHGDRGAQPHLPRASRLLRHGAVARTPAPSLASARRRGGRRRLHPRAPRTTRSRTCPTRTPSASRSRRWRTATSASPTPTSSGR